VAVPVVALLGLGLIGRPAARKLGDAGLEVRCWNRSALAAELVEGLRVVASPAEALDGADVVLLVLADSAATVEVLGRIDALLVPGMVVVDLGSSDPHDSRRHAAALSARGIGWVDAPISGGPARTASGELAIMAGGEAADIARARPVLEPLAGNLTHVGPAGAGHTMKIVNQVIVGLTVETVAEAVALAEAAGFTATDVQEAVRGGSADNPQLRVMGSRMATNAFEPAVAKAQTMLKDLRLALRLAEELGLHLPQLEVAAAQYEALAARSPDLDVSALVTLRRSGAGGRTHHPTGS
jgi:3-hydroxyisobutyrate dehydrogenase-like beta-hydroxyacid dehydrogenase